MAKPNHASLLADVLANPDDDGPRLVYADWLTEQGDPRGEFIALQCRLKRPLYGATGKSFPSDEKDMPADHATLAKREKQLVKQMTESLAPIRPFVREWVWQRGFLVEITVNGAFFPGAKEVLAAHPIRRLVITGLKKDEKRALAALELGTVRWIDLSRNRLEAKDAPLLCGPSFAKLESLFLWRNELGDEGVTALAEKSHLSRLRELGVPRCGFGDPAFRAIMGSAILANLEKLAVEENGVTETALVELAESGALPKLKVLGAAGALEELAPETRAALERRFDLDSARLRWEPYN